MLETINIVNLILNIDKYDVTSLSKQSLFTIEIVAFVVETISELAL